MNGLALIGGKSQRMGFDKSLLKYHNTPQWKYLYNLLYMYCDDVFLSCQQEQAHYIDDKHNTIEDHYGNGPLGGLLTAFEYSSTSAWLTVACDMPYISKATIEYLIKHHTPTCDATVFVNPHTQLIEPLLGIYQPTAYPLIKTKFQAGAYSLSAFLKEANSNLLVCPTPIWLENVNTLEAYKKFFD